MNLSSVKPSFADAHWIQTPHYYGQFALSMRKESLCIDIVNKKLRLIIHAVNTDTFHGTLSVSINGVWLYLGYIVWCIWFSMEACMLTCISQAAIPCVTEIVILTSHKKHTKCWSAGLTFTASPLNTITPKRKRLALRIRQPGC